MEPRFEIWNVLHDGDITALLEEGDAITIFVNIPYLRRRLKPLGDSFVLKLLGVQKAEWREFSGSTTSSLSDVFATGEPEILKSESESMPVTVETTLGWMILTYSSIELFLDSGDPVPYEIIERVCHEYWREWEDKAENGQGGEHAI